MDDDARGRDLDDDARGRDLDDDAVEMVSPPTTPWQEMLPVPAVLAESAPFASTVAHQYYYDPYLPEKHYQIDVKEAMHSFHPDLGPSPIWGLDGVFPGPTIDARYGEPWILQTFNNLPALSQHTGFGMPQTIFHMHNGHTATRSDGGPWNWDDPGGQSEYHHMMMRAGFTVPDTIPSEFRDEYGGDVRETLTTLFMHYHRPEFTASGVYKGLVNFVRFFDERDTGNEQDSSPLAWRLPSGPYDIPLLLADKQFDPFTGELIFDQFNLDGFLGDKQTVNGKIQPFFEVKRRKYRFRLLDAGPARFYLLVLRHDGENRPFRQITDNGNLLEAPLTRTHIELQVAERHDIVIDFSQFGAGDEVTLSNLFEMKDGRRPRRDEDDWLDPDDESNQLLMFVVTGDANDPSEIPSYFRPFPDIDLNEVVQTREWRFEREKGMWAINDTLWDPDIDHTPAFLNNPPHQIKRNTAERWILENDSGGWEHPIHIHLEEGQILKINGQAPKTKKRLDMYRLGRNTTIELFLRFRDFPDPDFGISQGLPLGEYTRYPMHCHNMTHEDHAMMVTWNVVP